MMCDLLRISLRVIHEWHAIRLDVAHESYH